MKQEIDVLVVGGGLTGAALMLALRDLGFSTLLVESQPLNQKINADFDARSLALSPASQRILGMLGVWPLLQEQTTPIHSIHVSEQHQFGSTRLNGSASAPLGYVAEMPAINQALQQLLDPNLILAPATVQSVDREQSQVTVMTSSGLREIKAGLIVAADGSHSTLRKHCQLSATTKLYLQQAIVANVGLTQSHDNCAYERFTQQGPLALLPLRQQRMALVWAMAPQEAQKVLSLSDQDFLSRLQQHFGYRVGRFTQVGTRFSYPLQQILMPQQVMGSIVFVGNAAHTLHPVAGQGFNLGLRDVATLAQCIAAQGLGEKMLQQYVQLRAQDQRMITQLTDGLVRLFSSRLPGLGILRGMALFAFDQSNTVKKILARYAQGYAGVIPDLVCEIALEESK